MKADHSGWVPGWACGAWVLAGMAGGFWLGQMSANQTLDDGEIAVFDGELFYRRDGSLHLVDFVDGGWKYKSPEGWSYIPEHYE